MNPGDLIDQHFLRLRSDQKRALKKLGVATIRDLLYHFPSRYEASGPAGTIASVAPGAEVTLVGTISKPEAKRSWKTRRPMGEAWLEDASGKIKLRWFSQPYIAKSLHEGQVVKVSGRVTGSPDKPYLSNPEIERSAVEPDKAHDSLFTKASGENIETLYPVYPESEGISSLWFMHAVRKAFEAGAHERLEDPLPRELLERYHLPVLSTALLWMHAPRSPKDAAAARKRFAFEEVLALQLAVQGERAQAVRERALPVSVDRQALANFVASFPFPPTAAQTRAIDAIVADFEKAHPMRRLLEGDVGSGKTAVAAATAYLVATSISPGRIAGTLQAAYLVPTEILAKQHFSTFVSYFRDHPIPIGLVTGSECRVFPSRVRYEESAKVSKATFRKRVADGLIPIVIGTHALVEKSLVFKHLAFAIIDEQHRFGTMHRQKLVQKQNANTHERKGMIYHTFSSPHLLSMTATPIPRTLALTIYGDLDLTLLDQMPAGRKPIETHVLGPKDREEAYARVRTELAAGRQAYVICPRIDEPDPAKELALQARSVKAEAARLAMDIFPSATIGILHSKMKPQEKEDVMNRFAAGDLDILVATSVVEVGVNVPNATVILIEGAERFGLSQLHQLRGRVIRSTHQAYCFALPETMGPATRERMKAFKNAKDGFELAEYDLKLRGAGELAGGKQWGVSDIAMEALQNIQMVEAARREAKLLIERDPELAAHPALALRARASGANLHLE